jgi:hypothetical protein
MSDIVPPAPTELPPGEIEFYDNVLPPLAAADYTINLGQTVAGDAISGSYTHNQAIQVAGPHFQLGSGAVFSMFPPAGSTADYTEALASVVLSTRNLPWEITADPNADQGSGPVVTPWLALLLLTAEDIVAPAVSAQGSATGAYAVPLAEYLRPGADFAQPSFTDAQVAEFEQQNPPDYRCTVIDVKGSAFTATAPQLAELPYLAHARQIDTGDQEIAGVEADGWFSVVIGNRLAQGSDSGVYFAHLVSVEGFTGWLPPTPLPAAVSTVRLLSLASWTFTGLASAGDFAGLMRNLDIGLLAMPNTVPAGATPAQQVVSTALAGGYTALGYQTRLGEQTVAWYRGPCLPVQMERNQQPSYPSAEAGLIYDQDTGLFDASYAVAWQAGRLMALANRQIAVALLKWLRAQHGMTQQLLGRLQLGLRYPSLGLSDDLAGLLEPRVVGRLARSRVATRLARAAAPTADDSGPVGGAPALGPPADPSGLRRVVARTPGLLSAAALRALPSEAGDLAEALLSALRHRAAQNRPELDR